MDDLVPAFFKLGMVGVLFSLLIAWVGRLLWRIDKLEGRVKELTDQLLLVADKRIADNRESNDVIRGNMTALATLNETVRNLTQSIQAVLRGGRR